MRNLKTCPASLKETSYKALVRSILEYSCTVWDPYFRKDVLAIEAVQRRAARFVVGDYRRTSSVTDMLNNLGWQSLETRRREARLILMYKVIHGLVAVPHEDHIKLNTTKTRDSALSTQRLYPYAPNLDVFKYSFFPRTILDWNGLNEDIKNAETLDIFKSNIRLD